MKKRTSQQKIIENRQDVLVKYVKRAGMWCKTYWVNGKQKQEWSKKKPTVAS